MYCGHLFGRTLVDWSYCRSLIWFHLILDIFRMAFFFVIYILISHFFGFGFTPFAGKGFQQFTTPDVVQLSRCWFKGVWRWTPASSYHRCLVMIRICDKFILVKKMLIKMIYIAHRQNIWTISSQQTNKKSTSRWATSKHGARQRAAWVFKETMQIENFSMYLENWMNFVISSFWWMKPNPVCTILLTWTKLVRPAESSMPSVSVWSLSLGRAKDGTLGTNAHQTERLETNRERKWYTKVPGMVLVLCLFDPCAYLQWRNFKWHCHFAEWDLTCIHFFAGKWLWSVMSKRMESFAVTRARSIRMVFCIFAAA